MKLDTETITEIFRLTCRAVCDWTGRNNCYLHRHLEFVANLNFRFVFVADYFSAFVWFLLLFSLSFFLLFFLVSISSLLLSSSPGIENLIFDSLEEFEENEEINTLAIRCIAALTNNGKKSKAQGCSSD